MLTLHISLHEPEIIKFIEVDLLLLSSQIELEIQKSIMKYGKRDINEKEYQQYLNEIWSMNAEYLDPSSIKLVMTTPPQERGWL